jgi:hypothetical protein
MRDYSEPPWACFGLGPDVSEDRRQSIAKYGPYVTDLLPGWPLKVLRAKGQRLIDRGLMTGCMCGCRGDMELTERCLMLLVEKFGETLGRVLNHA